MNNSKPSASQKLSVTGLSFEDNKIRGKGKNTAQYRKYELVPVSV